MNYKRVKTCPFCGEDAAKLEKYFESIDGRLDAMPFIYCRCGAQVVLLHSELIELQNKYNFKGGYLSNNKELWDDMHKKVIEKWNTRIGETKNE